MMAPAIRPRPDQIAELSRGLRLPLPRIEDDHLAILMQGLERAFHELLVVAPAVIQGGNEAEVTALLETRLNALIEADPFWGQLVLCVARGKESLSFDGSHLEKRPDLSIYLTNRTWSFPLIVEAKIIDSASGKTGTLYCDDGLRRFLIGEYGWGSREAFMIAYVRDASAIAGTLAPRLTSAAPGDPAYATEEGPIALENGTSDCARSRHGRSFLYTHQPSPLDAPGPISLWHLWLNAAANSQQDT